MGRVTDTLNGITSNGEDGLIRLYKLFHSIAKSKFFCNNFRKFSNCSDPLCIQLTRLGYICCSTCTRMLLYIYISRPLRRKRSGRAKKVLQEESYAELGGSPVGASIFIHGDQSKVEHYAQINSIEDHIEAQ